MLPYNFLILDAAKAESNLYKAQTLNPNFRSLYKGSAEEDLEGVAPFLFSIEANSDFSDWYHKNGWNNSWGILLYSNASFDEVYKHFRKFLMVKTEDGEQLYFRFYDPRVLRIFLPTCDAAQLKQLFGSVKYFIIETENESEVFQFWLENNTLKNNLHKIEELIVLVTNTDESPSSEVEVNDQDKDEKLEEETQEIQLISKKKKWDLKLE